MTLLPGVTDLLDRLVADPGVALGLLTGNWRSGAEIKLAPFGLGRYFAFGAFGDDGVDRAELPPVAMARAAAATGAAFAPADVLIVGDSPEDVACARAHGLCCLGVATGWTPAADLTAAGAAWVAADLPAAERLGCFVVR
jgi:phosphoglycolate phosphatase-like HAD superfamily hydrolase